MGTASDVVIQNIQRGPSPWYAVGAGLGAAVLLALVSLVVARKQRSADFVRLERELVGAAGRLDEQLRHDRELRANELESAAARLERQLSHDRQLRDLEHVRGALRPILQTLYGDEAVAGLLSGLEAAYEIEDVNRRHALVKPKCANLSTTLNKLLANRLELGGILGPRDPLCVELTSICAAARELGSAVEQWLAGLKGDDQMRSLSDSLGKRYGEQIGAFTSAAYDRVGWKPPPSS
jgi:hypothetical protein